MEGRGRYIPSNYRWFNRLLRYSIGLSLKLFFKVAGAGEGLARSLKPPFVLVSNHVTLLDAFILSAFLREPVYWITADGNMRSSLMRALLRLVGSIPKSKAIPDIETVNWTVQVIRKRGGVVGIFPEGQASWDGTTLPLIPSTAKLLKLLKVPVLSAVIRGGFSSYPRWSSALRRGRMEIEFKLAFEPADLKSLSVDEISIRLDAALAHDETAWNEAARVRYRALRRAERLELSLFMCPSCESIGTMRSLRSGFRCLSCGRALSIDARGRFKTASGDPPPFSSIRDWDRWQASAFPRMLAAALRSREMRPLFSDAGAVLLQGRKMNPLRSPRTGTLALYPDRLELATLLGERLSFPLEELDGVGVLKRNLLEFYRGRDLYQVRFPLRACSARKWLMAISALGREGRLPT